MPINVLKAKPAPNLLHHGMGEGRMYPRAEGEYR